MLAYKITKARLNNEEIIHKPQLKPLSEIALKIVARNFLLYKTLPNLPEEYKKKVYDLMAVDYKIEDIFPVINYEPFGKEHAENTLKVMTVLLMAIHGNNAMQRIILKNLYRHIIQMERTQKKPISY